MLVEEVEKDEKNQPFIKKIQNFDYNLYVHCRNVAVITEHITREMKIPDIVAKEIVLGALLHDIGKIYIPLDLLNLSRMLTGSEYALIKNHCAYGYELVKDFDISEIVLDIILHHHESEAGDGYPHRSTDMWYETKIVSLADKYEAIHSKRPYKQGYTHAETLMIMNYEFQRYGNVEPIEKALITFNDIRLQERS